MRLRVATINKPKINRQAYYMGEVGLNVVGIWPYGFKEPLWIMTNMFPEADVLVAALGAEQGETFFQVSPWG